MKYYCVKQHDATECGVACLATILKQYGTNISITKLREITGTDSMGTNATGLIKAAKSFGFSAKGVQGDQESFLSGFPLPAIAHVIVDGSLLHYVVIHKITKKNVIIADPAKGILKYSIEEFLKQWTGVLILLSPTSKMEKRNEKQGTLWRFFYLLIPQKNLLLQIFLSSLVITGLGIMASFYFRFIMDDIVPNTLEKTLTTVSLCIIGLYIFKILLEAFRTQLILYLSQKLDIPLILGYYQHVMGLSLGFFGSKKIGDLVSRFADASKIREAISGATLTIMIDTLMVVIGGIVLYMQNNTLFFIALVMVIIYGVIVFCFNHPIRSVNQEQLQRSAKLNSFLIESLNGVETIKAHNAEEDVETQTDTLFVRLLHSIFRGGSIGNFQRTLTNTVNVIGGVIIIWVGAYNVMKGEMTLGTLITFNALLGYFLEPIKNLINLQPTIQTALVAADRLLEIFDVPLEKADDEQKKICPKSFYIPISIKELDFRYGNRKLVLKDINLDIEPGQRVALVGESGSGKTTLVKLLMNFYTPEKGEIKFSNYNIQDINREVLRSKVAYISQDIFLFSGTIKENLTLGNKQISFEQVVEACQKSQLDDFINKLPLRYDTLIEENGRNLSGGQKQRLAIARALLKKPDILIMDEATSNLDSISEHAIEKMLTNLTDNMTTIVIAHRLNTVRHCDKIFVLSNGLIIEEGTHEDLIKSKGAYYNFYQEHSIGTEGN